MEDATAMAFLGALVLICGALLVTLIGAAVYHLADDWLWNRRHARRRSRRRSRRHGTRYRH